MARLTLLVTATLLVGLSPALAGAQTQQSTPPPAQEQTQPPPANPLSSASIERIQSAVNKPARLVIDEGKLRIYVEIIAKWPTFAEMAKGYDLKNGPTPRGNPMTHAEYLSLATPRDMISSAGIKPVEVLQFALVNWAGQALIKKAVQEFSRARDERELREIRERIDRELAILTGAAPVVVKK